MCSALTPLQICKILNLYTPVDEFEQRVPVSFIKKVQAKLQERPQSQEQQVCILFMYLPVKKYNDYLNIHLNVTLHIFALKGLKLEFK